MRVVVDTNVFVSAALRDKSFSTLALHVVEQRGTLLKSHATEAQLYEVIARPRIAALMDQTAVDWMRRLMAAAKLVTVTERIAACRDSTDDKFLELAVSGQAVGDVPLDRRRRPAPPAGAQSFGAELTSPFGDRDQGLAAAAVLDNLRKARRTRYTRFLAFRDDFAPNRANPSFW